MFTVNGKLCRYRIKTTHELCQCDRKDIHILSGIGGGYCQACDCTEEEARTIARVLLGFLMNRTMKTQWALYQELVRYDEDGNEYVPRKANDFSVRQGTTYAPLVPDDWDVNRAQPIVHAGINSKGWMGNIQYR